MYYPKEKLGGEKVLDTPVSVPNQKPGAAKAHPVTPSIADSHLSALPRRIWSPSAYSQGFKWLPK